MDIDLAYTLNACFPKVDTSSIKKYYSYTSKQRVSFVKKFLSKKTQFSYISQNHTHLHDLGPDGTQHVL